MDEDQHAAHTHLPWRLETGTATKKVMRKLEHAAKPLWAISLLSLQQSAEECSICDKCLQMQRSMVPCRLAQDLVQRLRY